MALKPEFMGLLRDIRDRIFPSVSASEENVTQMKDEVIELRETFDILSVKEPVNSIPNQPSGEVGLPIVTYNPETAQFEFGIPQGKNGKDFELKYVVENVEDLYTLVPESGEVAYVNANGNIYIKRYTNVNLNALDWTDGTPLAPSTTFKGLTDTPLEYTGHGEELVQVNTAEDGVEYIEKSTLPISTATQSALNTKEPTITKNTAFNKNFGEIAGTTMEGNAIETGSNTNGTWTKFIDGTLICKHSIIVPGTDTASGALYTSSTTPTWTFPIAFVGELPNVYGSSSQTTYTWVICSATQLTNAIIRPWRSASSPASLSFIVTAIGRWK